LGSENRSIEVKCLPGQKKPCEIPILKTKLGMDVHICNPSYVRFGDGELWSEASQSKNMKPCLKNKVKRVQGMAQELDHLPSKYKVLSSDFIP
jgi:hypothetical protein